jgi:hypothetical protein
MQLPQLFVACPELRPGMGNSLTSIDKDDLLGLKNDGRTVVANPDRAELQLSPAVRVSVKDHLLCG